MNVVEILRLISLKADQQLGCKVSACAVGKSQGFLSKVAWRRGHSDIVALVDESRANRSVWDRVYRERVADRPEKRFAMTSPMGTEAR